MARARSGTEPAAARRFPFARFARRALAWLVPVGLVWWLLTPFYNRMLTIGTEHLVRLIERPSVTRLVPAQTHYFLLYRSDVRGRSSGGQLSSVRVTDTHFPLVLTGVLFLAVPGLGLRRRLRNLGLALLISLPFHLVSLLFWVEFVYATQLGGWSLQHYGAVARNFWGLGKHLLDLPFKFALPMILWCGLHMEMLGVGGGEASRVLRSRRHAARKSSEPGNAAR